MLLRRQLDKYRRRLLTLLQDKHILCERHLGWARVRDHATAAGTAGGRVKRRYRKRKDRATESTAGSVHPATSGPSTSDPDLPAPPPVTAPTPLLSPPSTAFPSLEASASNSLSSALVSTSADVPINIFDDDDEEEDEALTIDA